MTADPLLIRAYRGEKTERAPVWFMRQAGRYLPEYRAVRAQHSMLEVIRTPEIACRVTLQPVDRFAFDAAIIFADILNPLMGMGVELDFVEGQGPRICNPPRSRAAIEKLAVPRPEDNVGYTLRAIALAVQKLAPRGIPLIGFAGAPFTLSSYLCDQGERGLPNVRRLMSVEADTWALLQEKLSALVADYLVAQVRAGAAAVQIFDTWAGLLTPAEYSEYVLPYLKRIIAAVKRQTQAPLVYFAADAAALLPLFKHLGADVISVDWRISLAQADALLGHCCPLQGNLNPELLLGAWEGVEESARGILQEGRALRGFVFNLGHGILPTTPPEHVARVAALVRGSMI